MTARQEAFAREYLVDLNATQAAIRAGYAPGRSAEVTASRLLRNPKVAAAIEAGKRERARATKIDAEWVLRQLREVYERCVSELKPALDPHSHKPLLTEDGRPLYTFNANAALRALDLIGKHIDVGAYEEKVSVQHDLAERLKGARRRISTVIEGEAREVVPAGELA